MRPLRMMPSEPDSSHSDEKRSLSSAGALCVNRFLKYGMNERSCRIVSGIDERKPFVSCDVQRTIEAPQ